jgi:hypothetical protein
VPSKHLGLSTVDAGHLDEAQRVAPVAAIQNFFEPTDPDEDALLERAAAEQIALAKGDHRTAIVLTDDIDLVADPGDALRASALELYAADVSCAFVVAASPGLFGTVHEGP